MLKNLAKLSKYMGKGEVNISTFIKAPCTKLFLEVPQTHRNISNHLGGVDTSMSRVLVFKNLAKLSKYMGKGKVNISTFIKAPCTKLFLEVPQTHRNISRPLGRC